MTLKKLVCLVSALAAWAAAGVAHSQVDKEDWKEAEVPPPPAFSVSRLLPFDVSPNSSLTFAVDQDSVVVSRDDGVTRYVMVASSKTGARNVLYEGIRCETAEVKTYARYTAEGQWVPVRQPEWKSLFDNMPSKHALRLAKAGMCDGKAPATSTQEVVRQLRAGTNFGNAAD
jgi:hypothetical protein